MLMAFTVQFLWKCEASQLKVYMLYQELLHTVSSL